MEYKKSPCFWKMTGSAGFLRVRQEGGRHMFVSSDREKWQGSITHTCSWNDQAQKNHYLMAQISDFVKQLYEYYYLKKNGIEKKQKL